MTRYNFWDLFREDSATRRLTPLRRLRIRNILIGPGVSFSHGVSMGGINIFEFYGCDIEADDINGVIVIRGFYR